MHAVIAFADPTGADPDVAVHVGANAVGESGLAVQVHVDEFPALTQLGSIYHIINHDVLRRFFVVGRAGVGHVQLFVVRRET